MSLLVVGLSVPAIPRIGFSVAVISLVAIFLMALSSENAMTAVKRWALAFGSVGLGAVLTLIALMFLTNKAGSTENIFSILATSLSLFAAVSIPVAYTGYSIRRGSSRSIRNGILSLMVPGAWIGMSAASDASFAVLLGSFFVFGAISRFDREGLRTYLFAQWPILAILAASFVFAGLDELSSKWGLSTSPLTTKYFETLYLLPAFFTALFLSGLIVSFVARFAFRRSNGPGSPHANEISGLQRAS